MDLIDTSSKKWFYPLIGMDGLKYEGPHRTLIADFSLCFNWEDTWKQVPSSQPHRSKWARPHRPLIAYMLINVLIKSNDFCSKLLTSEK